MQEIAGNNRDRYVFINFLILISYYKYNIK